MRGRGSLLHLRSYTSIAAEVQKSRFPLAYIGGRGERSVSLITKNASVPFQSGSSSRSARWLGPLMQAEGCRE